MKTNRIITLFLILAMNVAMAFSENYPYRSDYLWYTVPNHSDWLYKVGEEASIDVMFLKYGIPQEGVVEYEIADELCDADSRGKITLKQGKGIIKGVKSKKPGFRDVRMKIKIDDVSYQHHIKVGFSPEKIVPYTKEPADFLSWWQNNIDENHKYPLKYTRELYKPYCTESVDCYLMKIEVNSSHQSMYGYLLCPKNMTQSNHPVVLCPPGAGVKTIKDTDLRNYYPENGIIRLVMEIHGLNPTLDESTFVDIRAAFDGKSKGYLYQGLESRERFYMKHVYEGLIKCVDFLTSMPEWDGKNVILQGGSQGGALSLVVAGLDTRVTHVIVNHPALADMALAEKGGVSGYPHYTKKDGMLTPEKLNTMAYYDVVNFARHISAKTYMTWGYNDNTCPPTTSYAVWNTLSCPKESLITPINEHWTSDATNREQCTWILRNLR